jgi:hypothetical protein
MQDWGAKKEGSVEGFRQPFVDIAGLLIFPIPNNFPEKRVKDRRKVSFRFLLEGIPFFAR